MRFLRSGHLVALVLTLLAIEAAMRLGAYEPVASPASHSGVTIKLKNAMRSYGREKVDAVTLGDSRAVQGLDNRLIFEASRAAGINHLRMSMPGSHMLTLKALGAWSVSELPSLKGIVLALSTDDFGRLGSGPYELAKVLPLRNSITVREMLHHVPFKRSDLRTYAPFYSIAGYRDDIKDLLAHPELRLKAIIRRNQTPPLSLLAYNAKAASDICAVSTSDPAACLAQLPGLRGEIPDRAWNGLNILCGSAAQDKETVTAPGKAAQELIKDWTDFLRNLAGEVRVMVVLLPDHSLFMSHLYPPNAGYIAHAVLSGLQREGVIEVVDMRALMVGQARPECSFYMDARHLNNQGKQRLTRELLPHLKEFWAHLDAHGLR